MMIKQLAGLMATYINTTKTLNIRYLSNKRVGPRNSKSGSQNPVSSGNYIQATGKN
jgi:hypothetical protein